MNYYILSIGNMKKSPENEIFNKYLKRLTHKLFLKEYVSHLPSGQARIKDECKNLLDMVNENSKLILLDERGENISSNGFSNILTKFRNESFNNIYFIIGGADGVTEEVFNKADKIFSFGRMTWPHILTRLMLIEQIYRSETIISGHPYHRQ
tara:strand:- start:597 stop:1052 length:456 start_codon:yes stop_codon:yes gene_type:complete